MDIIFNKQTLKEPFFWAFVIPLLLTIWAIIALVGMLGERGDSLDAQQTAGVVSKQAGEIVKIRKRLGIALAGASSHNFRGITSARACAKIAGISEARLSRAESPRPQRQKDGSTLHRETYKLNNIKLLQIVKFVDYAERNFSSVTCHQLSITSVRSKSKDAWEATVVIQYLIKG